jgi:hypothetical protein
MNISGHPWKEILLNYLQKILNFPKVSAIIPYMKNSIYP